jgi:four helix bundle protein
MAVRHFSQLVVWQLAEAVRVRVFAFTERPRFAADLRAKAQAEDASNSVCRNIAEGFGCVSHDEFARYLEIARRSLNELHDALHSAQLKKYVTLADLVPIGELSNRLYPAFSGLIGYLRNNPTPERRLNRSKKAPSGKKHRTDKRQEARTDKRQELRTDSRQEVRTDAKA